MMNPSMHLAHVALLLLPVAGCAVIDPAAPIASPPEVVAQQRPTAPLSEVVTTRSPTAPRPAAKPTQPTAPLPGAGARASATATPKPSSTVTRAPAEPTAAATERKSAARAAETPVDAVRVPAAPTSAATEAKRAPRPVAAVPVPEPAAAPSLDLNGLKEQLKETKAIGVFTKLSLKNQVDDLLQQFRDHYQGKAKITIAQLRRSYDLLLMKVLSLVQDADQRLASEIVASREAIWSLLADRQKFSTLEV